MKRARGTKADEAKMARGSARKAHFAAGGSAAAWVMRGSRVEDRKHLNDRRACRGRVNAED